MQAATTTVKGFVIESETATTVYYDIIQFTNTASSATTTYAYDHTGERVKLTEGSTTTYFPSKLYEQQGTTGTTTKHIFANGVLIATVEKATASSTPTVRYIHTDHLTGSNVVTDASGAQVQALDYYPYGSRRIHTGTDVSRREFAGMERDESTGLDYAMARYYAGGKGRFLSEDPVFLSVGSPDLKQKTGLELQKYLENPQTHNSYSYTANNPLKYVDKEGEWLDTVVDIVALAYSGYRLGQAIVNGGDVRGEAGNLALDVGGAFIPGVAGLGTLRRIEKAANTVEDAGKALDKSSLSESALVCRGGSCKQKTF
jgi:RHS repeat-associated protein